MKLKTRLVGALLAGVIAFAGIPDVVQPLTPEISAASDTSSKKLAAPKSFTATASGTMTKLTWKKVTGADAYKVYMLNTNTGKYETLKNVTKTYLNIKNLKAGKHKFIVAALVKNGTKYSVQTLSSVLTVQVVTPSTNTAGAPVTFPAFGTDKAAAIKQMGLKQGIESGQINEGVYSYAGLKKINGVDCMVILSFSSTGKFFYGAAIFPDEAMKFSKLYSDLKTLKGTADLSISNEGMDFYEWIDEKNESLVGAIGSDASKTAMYIAISLKYAPASIKNTTPNSLIELFNALSEIVLG